MGNCAMVRLPAVCDAVVDSLASGCFFFCQSVCEEYAVIRERVASVGNHVFAWLKSVARDVAAAFSSVSGLSTMLYLAQSINGLVREVMSRVPEWGMPFNPFDTSQYDSVVWATRVFTDPDYYVGGGMEVDIRLRRVFAIASRIFGTVWNVATFCVWLKDQGCHWMANMGVLLSQSSCMWWARRISVDTFFSGTLIFSYFCMFVERVREIANGKHILFAVVDGLSNLLESVSYTLALFAVEVPLVAAMLQAVAAGIGVASIFLDPGVT